MVVKHGQVSKARFWFMELCHDCLARSCLQGKVLVYRAMSWLLSKVMRPRQGSIDICHG